MPVLSLPKESAAGPFFKYRPYGGLWWTAAIESVSGNGGNPITLIDPLGLHISGAAHEGMVLKPYGDGRPTQTDMMLMSPPTKLLDGLYGFGMDPWSIQNRIIMEAYSTSVQGIAIEGLIAGEPRYLYIPEVQLKFL